MQIRSSFKPGSFDLVSVVGMEYEDALQSIVAAGYRPRLVRRDGYALMATRDYRLDRINLQISNNVVTDANFG